MKKGCLLTIAVGVPATMLVLIGGCYWAAMQYEKGPRPPGEVQFYAADRELDVYKDAEGFGNTPEAREQAVKFARALRLSRQVLFTEGKAGGISFSQGNFITYCHYLTNKCAFIVHVPELRRYAADAKVSMAELAWTMAAENLRTANMETRHLAVGIRGVMDYAWIFIGTPNATNPLAGITQRHNGTSREPLYPFFTEARHP